MGIRRFGGVSQAFDLAGITNTVGAPFFASLQKPADGLSPNFFGDWKSVNVASVPSLSFLGVLRFLCR